jgi:hypothetical protein
VRSGREIKARDCAKRGGECQADKRAIGQPAVGCTSEREIGQ